MGYYAVALPIPSRAASLEEWFCKGDFELTFRTRYEFDHNNAYAELGINPKHNGRAVTLASTLSYNTAQWARLFGVLDFNNVTAYFNSRYNSGNNTSPSRISYALIPDPEGTAVVQAYLGFEAIPDTILLGGRQVISLDNQRFVGPSDFRQMPQSFDSAAFFNDAISNVEFFYAFVGQVNTIWQGNDCAFFPQRTNSTHLINISSDLKPLGKLIAYGYFINDHDIALNSNQTLGLRYLNQVEFPYFTFYGQTEYARQNDLANNPIDYHANYVHFVLGTIISFVDLHGGYEVLSGNDKAPGKAFQTPLGSQHIFNGLADVFVIIPVAGLEDLYAQCELNFWGISLFGQYHHFRAQANSDKYGEEWDAGISYRFLKHYELSVEYADFIGNAVTGYPDVRKVWASFTAQFG